MAAFENTRVADVFSGYPVATRNRLLRLREIIFDVAANTDGVGKLQETLKWGDPAYVTVQSGSGSTIRIARCKNAEKHYAIYFHCQTNLVETFRTLFPGVFEFEGNRSIVFAEQDLVPIGELRICIAMALTYHLARKRNRAEASAHRNMTSRSTRVKRAPG